MLALALVLTSTVFAASPLDAYAAAIGRAPIATAVDQKGTFRDLQFGTACSAVYGFLPGKSVGSFQAYSRPTDKLAVGAATLDKLAYLCANDRLSVVLMTGKTGGGAFVKSALVSLYGNPGLTETGFQYWRGLTRTVWYVEEGDNFIASIGDLPWGDPVALVSTILKQSNSAAQSDL